MRLIFDNNIWISFAIGNHMKQLPAILIRPDVELFACQELIDEFEKVCQYERVAKYLKPKRLADTVELIHAKAQIIQIKAQTADFSDPKDNYLLDLCQEAGADYLVTGDKKLQQLEIYKTTRIISYNFLCDLLGTQE